MARHRDQQADHDCHNKRATKGIEFPNPTHRGPQPPEQLLQKANGSFHNRKRQCDPRKIVRVEPQLFRIAIRPDYLVNPPVDI
jgi:hypothetical protein